MEGVDDDRRRIRCRWSIRQQVDTRYLFEYRKMNAEDWVRVINTGLNLLALPAMGILWGIKTQLATLNERLSGINRRVEMLESRKP